MRDINRFYTHDVFVVRFLLFFLSFSVPFYHLCSSLHRRQRRWSQHFHHICASEVKPTLSVSRNGALDSVSVSSGCLRCRPIISSIQIDCIDLNMCVGLFIFDVKKRWKKLARIVIRRFLGYEYECNANRRIETKRRITATTTTGTNAVRRQQRISNKYVST